MSCKHFQMIAREPNGGNILEGSYLQNNKGAVMRISSDMVISYAILNPVNPQTAGRENFQRSFKDDQRSYRMTEEQIASPAQYQ